MLESEVPAERATGVHWVWAIGVASAEPDVRLALVAELERTIALAAEARRQGIATATLVGPEYYAHVQQLVASLKDPGTIPVLARALGGGFNLTPYLSDFGEQAAPAVLDVVIAPESDHYAVDDGLRVLRMMVEGRATRPLTDQTVAGIREAAEQRLTGPQYFTTVWYALDLAAVLDDPGLDQKLESIAADDAKVVALGIDDPRIIELTQRRAAARLAGIPALPRREQLSTN